MAVESPRWSLFVVGRRRPQVLLSDGGEDALAELQLRGGGRGSLGRATERDGRRFDAFLDGGEVRVECAGRVLVRAQGEELTTGGGAYPRKADLEGGRTASLTDDDGTPLLQIEPGPGGDGPWITIAWSDHLPSPLAVTLATCFVLLRVDALGRRG